MAKEDKVGKAHRWSGFVQPIMLDNDMFNT